MENSQKTELTKLRMRELNLSNKGITDEVLRDMRFDGDITNIDLSFNSIQNLDNVRFPDELQILYLGYNQIQNLDNVRFPDRLQVLHLSNNQIKNLENVRFPDRLQVLHLSNNQIQNLDNVRFPDGLQVLSLYGNHIKSVDKCWISPSTRITADDSIKTAIRESTRNMAATRIQQNFRRYLIRHHNAALTIQKWYVAQSYRTKGVVFRNSMEQYP